jgi:hypothetical protein
VPSAAGWLAGTLIVATAATLLSWTASLPAQSELPYLIFQASFEIGLDPGQLGIVEDAGWNIGNSTIENSGIMRPDIGVFGQNEPLAEPADAAHLLFIDDLGESSGPYDNTFVAVNTRIVIQENASYRITAATGHAVDATIGDQTIEAWVQPPPRDGEILRRGLIARNDTTQDWRVADEGQWIDNFVQFTAAPGLLATHPDTGQSNIPVIGSELIILVQNFDSDCCGIPGGQPGIVYWDNFRVTSDVPRAALKAGDADQDLDFDQLDLVRVQMGAKYLTGQLATWGDGDWDGAPGGSPGDPPPGDLFFDQRDIIAALASGVYLTGPYATIRPQPLAGVRSTAFVSDTPAPPIAIPEPQSGRLMWIGLALLTMAVIPRRS